MSTVRPEVVRLLTGHDPHASSPMDLRYVRRDGTPYTEEETRLVASASIAELQAASAVAEAEGELISARIDGLPRIAAILDRHGAASLAEAVELLTPDELAEVEQLTDKIMPGWRP